MTQTPFQVLSRPLPERPDFFHSDPVLRDLLARLLAPAALSWLEPRLRRMGEDAAGSVDASARVADRLSPVLRTFDPWGRRVDEIVHHPSYREMERVAYGSGMVGLKYDPEVAVAHPGARHVMGFALGYLFAQAESGLYCPVCMTDGVARVLELLGSPRQRAEYVPRLAETDLSRLWRGAMFLTEKQAGSDVGAVATRAVPDGDGWRLYGEKWFCSNVDAEAVLTLARPDGAAPGTRGLGLFFLRRDLPGVGRNGLRIDRIKEKLGVRSMATGEVVLDGARAELVGPLDGGFKGMAEMLNLSRLYNAFASVAIVRRAAVESTLYLRARDTFGRAGASHPLVREGLADLQAEEVAAKHFAFRVAALLDRADLGSQADATRVRLLTPLVKLTTAKLAVWAASEAIELHGGNGYIEEFVTARLLRDAQVLPVWEGTTNILVLDALRACRKGAPQALLLDDVEARCAAAPSQAGETAGRLAGLAARLRQAWPEVAESPAERQAPLARRWTEELAFAWSVSALLEPGAAPGIERVLLAAARRLVRRRLEPDWRTAPSDLDALVEGTVV